MSAWIRLRAGTGNWPGRVAVLSYRHSDVLLLRGGAVPGRVQDIKQRAAVKRRFKIMFGS